jgi:murein L,D-transpeptidase YcbB/YkuD
MISAAGLPAAEIDAKADLIPGIEQMLRSDNLRIQGAEVMTQALILEAYEGQDFKPFWTDQKKVSELLRLIMDASDHGLSPADYNVAVLQLLLSRQSETPSPNLEAQLDILLTESLLRYGYHRRFGKVKGSSLDAAINFKREAFTNGSLTITLQNALNSTSLPDFIELVAPTGPMYRRLQYKLDLYRDIAVVGGWPAVSEGPTLRLNDDDPRVAEVRRRLAVTGDLAPEDDNGSTQFDPAVETAVKLFQWRHALDDDGIVGKQSIAAMNVPVETRIDQLRLSLERLRWVRQEAASRFVAVNIAGFRVFYFNDGLIEWESRAMVGKNYRQTPVFRGDMAYLEFNPTWTIPPGILRNDTLPAIKRDPNYLSSKNIRVIDRNGQFVDPATVDWNKYSRGVPYTLRQDPGPNNSLGTVKFIFPNEHFVFLHDTPHRELFSRAERAFSSGCIRVQDPLALGELVLDDPEKYPRSTLEDIVASKKTQRINLQTKMPVLIVYLTASVLPGEKVRFLKDIYNRDQKVLDALNGPVIIDPPERG